jgi:hypothetical protein
MNNFSVARGDFGLAFWTKQKYPKGALLFGQCLVSGLVAIGYFATAPHGRVEVNSWRLPLTA